MSGRIPGRRELMRAPSLWIALAVLFLLVGSFLVTSDEGARCGRIDARLAWRGPEWQCPTGYDSDGRCVGRNLMGGIHEFLGPGALAALLVGLGGTLGGVGTSYLGERARALTMAGLTLIESLPRLVVLLMVYGLWEQSMPVLGGALGLLMTPALAGRVADRIRRLEPVDYLQSARAHGIPERRILWRHLVWLSCGGEILRYMVYTFGHMIAIETSLSYVRQSSMGTFGCSWGYLLQRSIFALYDSVAWLRVWLKHPARGGFVWPPGMPQLMSVAAAILLVLWAIHRVGRALSGADEREPHR